MCKYNNLLQLIDTKYKGLEHPYCLDGKRYSKNRLSSLYSFPLHLKLGQQEAGEMAQLEEDLSVSPGPHEKPGRYPHVIPHKGGRDRRVLALLASRLTLLWHVPGQ